MKIKTENEKKNINYISVKSSDFGIAQNNSVEFYFDHYSKRIVLDASSGIIRLVKRNAKQI